MKASKLILAAALAAAALAHTAPAQTAIYISGAPATRHIFNTSIYNTIANQVATGGSSHLVVYWSNGAANPNNNWQDSNNIVITGGSIGGTVGSGTAVTIYATWGGSTGGNQQVAQNPPEGNTNLQTAFISSTQIAAVAATSSTGGGVTGTVADKHYPHFNLSDTFQSTTPFHGRVTITNPVTNYVTLTETQPNNPAITGFKFVTNNGTPARLNNITTQLARLLFSTETASQQVSLAQFTGLSSDEGTSVYAVGRDIGSGARYILLAEAGIGIANSTSLFQFSTNINGGNVITSYSPATGATINLITVATGNNGYSSFSNVLTALKATSTAGPLITYVTDTDAANAEQYGAHELTWNGVAYGTSYEGANNTAPTSIAEGQYTYWSYLHVYYNNSYIQANHPLSYVLANAIGSDLSTDTGTGAILNSDVNVGRLSDGSLVSF